jgi:hypothetical protein
MNTFIQDLRHGLRQLLRSPAFAGFLVLALGLGNGVNVALFRLLARVGGSGELSTISGAHPIPGWAPLPASARMGCVDIGVMGLHTSVDYRLARRSGEIGVRVAVGEAGAESCA